MEQKGHPRRLTFRVGGVSFSMILVEHGTFVMGREPERDGDQYYDDKRAHEVMLTQDYYIGETQVTQALWAAVMGSNPSKMRGDDERPVENVFWGECQTFVEKLNGQVEGVRFALPTEAQWEYAARGGNRSKGYKYAGADEPDEVAWHKGNAGGETHPVGQKKANEIGVYDMAGNVWEWCADWYGEYPTEAVEEPKGPETGDSRVIRGGSFGSRADRSRSAYRDAYAPEMRDGEIGLRLVCIVVGPTGDK